MWSALIAKGTCQGSYSFYPQARQRGTSSATKKHEGGDERREKKEKGAGGEDEVSRGCDARHERYDDEYVQRYSEERE